MEKTLIIGANGQIGRQLVKRLRAQHFPVQVLLRDPTQAAWFEAQGVEVVIGDLEQTLPDTAFIDCSHIVFTAGSGGHTGADKTILVDLWGACQAIDKARQHHCKHFIMVSAKDAGDPDQGSAQIKHYNICKHFADNYLIQSGVPYTILRPGRLTDGPDTGQLTTVRPSGTSQQMITRADVAAAIFYSLQHLPTLSSMELYQGDTPLQRIFARD